jgi:hypothetical protein
MRDCIDLLGVVTCGLALVPVVEAAPVHRFHAHLIRVNLSALSVSISEHDGSRVYRC